METDVGDASLIRQNNVMLEVSRFLRSRNKVLTAAASSKPASEQFPSGKNKRTDASSCVAARDCRSPRCPCDHATERFLQNPRCFDVDPLEGHFQGILVRRDGKRGRSVDQFVVDQAL